MFDEIGSRKKVCIAQKTRHVSTLNQFASRWVNVYYVKFDAIYGKSNLLDS